MAEQKKWWWVWEQFKPAHYTPAASPEEAARKYAESEEVSHRSRIHVALSSQAFSFQFVKAEDES